MYERWYKQGFIYCRDVETFQDSNGDGVGDFAGLTTGLDHRARPAPHSAGPARRRHR